MILILLLLVLCTACEKTYEDGPLISLRSKKNRITGKWKLVKLKGVDWVDPSKDQYMKLTENEDGNGRYKAKFTNFQYFDDCGSSPFKLYSGKGSWEFLSDEILYCNTRESLEKNEGLFLKFHAANESVFHKSKILKLKKQRAQNRFLFVLFGGLLV